MYLQSFMFAHIFTVLFIVSVLYFSYRFELPSDVMYFKTERLPLIYFKTYVTAMNSFNLSLSVNVFIFLHL